MLTFQRNKTMTRCRSNMQDTLKEETWREVAISPSYSVSSMGRVMRKAKITLINGNKTRLKEKLRATADYRGYRRLILCPPKKLFSVHRLVADAFIPNPDNKKTVNHKNGIRSDNRVENLEWATQSENLHHAVNVLKTIPRGESCVFSKLSEDDVLNIRTLHKFGATIRDLAKVFDTRKGNIEFILKRKTWKFIP